MIITAAVANAGNAVNFTWYSALRIGFESLRAHRSGFLAFLVVRRRSGYCEQYDLASKLVHRPRWRRIGSRRGRDVRLVWRGRVSAAERRHVCAWRWRHVGSPWRWAFRSSGRRTFGPSRGRPLCPPGRWAFGSARGRSFHPSKGRSMEWARRPPLHEQHPTVARFRQGTARSRHE